GGGRWRRAARARGGGGRGAGGGGGGAASPGCLPPRGGDAFCGRGGGVPAILHNKPTSRRRDASEVFRQYGQEVRNARSRWLLGVGLRTRQGVLSQGPGAARIRARHGGAPIRQ